MRSTRERFTHVPKNQNDGAPDHVLFGGDVGGHGGRGEKNERNGAGGG